MRNLRVLRKFDSGSPLPLPDSSIFSIGSNSFLFDVIGLAESVNGGNNCKYFLSNLTRVSEFGHIEELTRSNLLQDVFHMQFVTTTGCLYLGTKRGQFLQFYTHMGEIEELFQSEAGFAMFAVSPDSRLVVLVTRTGILQLLSLATLELLFQQVIYEHASTDVVEFTVNLCWRHDSQYFVLNIPDKVTGRRLKVYDEHGTLFSSSEDSTQLVSDVLCWQPSGGLIAAIERAPVGKDGCLISFFELNGLKRSSFNPYEVPGTQLEESIMSMSWNSSSDILAVRKRMRVELWHRSNYHWMLKGIIQRNLSESQVDDIKFFAWDIEHAYKLYIVFQSGYYSFYDYNLTYSSGYSDGSALTVSINGCNLYCTPFRDNSAPPPYGFSQILLEFPVKEVVVSSFWNGFLCILFNGKIVLIKNSGQRMVVFKILAVGDELDIFTTYNWIWPNSRTIGSISGNRILVFELPEDFYRSDSESPSSNLTQKHAIKMNCSSISVVREQDSLESNHLLVRKHGGSILLLNLMNLENEQPTMLFKVPPDGFHDLKQLWTVGSSPEDSIENRIIIICHDSYTRKLEIFLGSKASAKLASDCTSTAILDDYLLFTTIQGTLEIIHVTELEKALTASANGQRTLLDQYSRKVEKGSVILSCCWNRMLEPTVILQVLPRGNIETIHPRPLVISSIRKILRDEKKRSFNIIMGAMRRHRIDANVLIDELKRVESEGISNLTMKKALESMVAEVQDQNLLVLFVTEVSSENLDCILLLVTVLQEYVQRPDGKNTIQPYLAAMAKMGRYEEVLNSPLIIGEEDREVVKSRIKFLSFYADNADTLYDAALGTYDLNLTAIVADCLNKDPKEYLPILNNLRSLVYVKRCFSIDNSLKRWAKGIKSLLEDSTVQIQEITKFVLRHQLFRDALSLLGENSVAEARSTEEINSIQKAIQESYGEYLETHAKFREASIFYKRAGNVDKAYDSLVKAGSWESALAVIEDPVGFDKSCRDLLQLLVQKKEWEGAARLCEVYLKDYPLAIEFWINAHKWTFAHGLTNKDPSLKNLTTDLMKPKILEHHTALNDFLRNFLLEFQHHIARLRAIKAKREAMKDAGIEEGDNFSDTESISTTSSTRSTSSNQSGRTYRSGKSKRKMERKLHSLKEGSRYEDLAIIVRVSDSTTRIHVETKPDVANTVEYLWRFQFDENAIQLTSLFDQVLGEVDGIVKEIWSLPILENPILEPKYRIAPILSTSWEKPSFLT